MEYTIKYKTINQYKKPVQRAYWQFLIVPETNDSQNLGESSFKNSLDIPVQNSINGYGFETYRVAPNKIFQSIEFEAEFRLTKEILNPFGNLDYRDPAIDFQEISSLEFRSDHERFLKETQSTALPKNSELSFKFDSSISLFDNLKKLNAWIFNTFTFKPQVTQINTNLSEILEHKHGVCQDFTHLFCALARKNGMPTRYVSGYLHQGIGYLGDSQMHAWAESFVPGAGWVGFDPTNNLLAAENHIKVGHGKDYADCPPLKGVVYTAGGNTTSYTVEVIADQEGMRQVQNGDGSMQQEMGTMVQKMEFRDLFQKNDLPDQ
ncbi:transglutaminase-like domain-containing protein [Flavimarina sp. Hel_I_48]|uniref:transglutaminase-like domain-containing protein n=1 Tax=Flavimarina sp. Hel_I_48 TaxID=1392488 RepID=UPI0009DFE0C7|nr:transglutaminase family protein [Flavimarina sp. Hel_I_48]